MSNDSNCAAKAAAKPLNWRQRLFADYLLLHPDNQAEAYRQAGYESTKPERDAVALMKRANVREYIARERARLTRLANFKKEDLVRFLVRVIDTPIEEIDASSPLCQEAKPTMFGVAYKMPCKLGAAEKLARILGWNEPEKMPEGLGDALTGLMQRIRGGGK